MLNKFFNTVAKPVDSLLNDYMDMPGKDKETVQFAGVLSFGVMTGLTIATGGGYLPLMCVAATVAIGLRGLQLKENKEEFSKAKRQQQKI